MKSWSKELEDLEKYLGSIKGQVQNLEKELQSLLKASEDVTTLLFARRSLEVMISDLCETALNRPRGSEPLQGIVDRLVKDEIIPESIHTSMSNLIRISNYGAQPKDFDPRQVRGALIDLSVVVEWYIDFKNFTLINPDPLMFVQENKVEPKEIKEDITKGKIFFIPKQPIQTIKYNLGQVNDIFVEILTGSISNLLRQMKKGHWGDVRCTTLAIWALNTIFKYLNLEDKAFNDLKKKLKPAFEWLDKKVIKESLV
jgi:hypothetical protein